MAAIFQQRRATPLEHDILLGPDYEQLRGSLDVPDIAWAIGRRASSMGQTTRSQQCETPTL